MQDKGGFEQLNKQPFDKNILFRYAVLFVIIAIASIAIVSRLFKLQVVMGDYYKEQSENRLIRTMPLKAPRGEILDRYGRPLITNRQGFSVVFYKEYIQSENLNSLILKTADAAEAHSVIYIDTFPITKTYPFEFDFPNTANEDIQVLADKFKHEKKIDVSANANDVVNYFAEQYKIDGGYTTEQLRKIIGIRYEMENRLFSNNVPYTFATDVSIDFVTYIKEQQQDFQGVSILVEPIREYANNTLAAHILGRVGVMYKEEYQQLKDKGYNINDLIGKDGIEKYLEDSLKGVDGTSSAEHNIGGAMSRVLESRPPIPGNNAILTLDLHLQQALESSLGDMISKLQTKAGNKDVITGSGVVIDVNNGEVLAMASHPTFDPARFNEQWASLSHDNSRPMWNRAIAGQYAPGSVFKILSAFAALESDTVSPDDTINCSGVYRFYASSGYTPVCWYYSSYGRGHDAQNVTQALENSCNYYFYEVGRRMGIDTLYKYGKKFGLGEYTGIELSGEEKGNFASPEYREKIGTVWYPGDTLQAAIGQSDHLFTPIQLANFMATVANGGKRHKVHLIKSIKSYDTAETVYENKPEIIELIDVEYPNYKAITNGLRKVSETGTASAAFSGFDVSVASKTGSASVPSGAANGLFVAFAPFDDPQIALALVVEHAGSGSAIAPVARDVIKAYMMGETVDDQISPYNELIK
ncbi:MAG: hypothetical protein GX800_03485 [Clostridiaceae bacterium]|nr:hypothetical protein [Clostridiaceae bacterium]